jgi:phage gpG-like protein
MSNKNKWEHLKKLLTKTKSEKKKLPRVIANIALNHFKKSFIKGGFTDGGFEKWPERKNDKTPGRATLVKSGQLRRSTRIAEANERRILIVNALPYAYIHNDGGVVNRAARSQTMSFSRKSGGGLQLAKTRTNRQRGQIVAQSRSQIGASSFRMPQRKFMGDSRQLRANIKKRIIKQMALK